MLALDFLCRMLPKFAISSKKRDDQPRSPDHFCVFLDTYNDNENGMAFFTNPTGARTDFSISDDGALRNMTWNTFWDVKTSTDDKGWYVEMKIPFSSLRFNPENNITTMGLILKRCYKSNAELDTYPAVDPKYGFGAFTKPSLSSTIEFEGIKPTNPVYVSPYIIGGNTRNWVLNSLGDEYVKKDKAEFNAGLDVKYNINSNLTIDLTANTDFAQVEADDQQVNLTRYSLYFPEKRAFFQERSGLFSFDLGNQSNLFYSRNIGLSKGAPVRIYGGARLVGKIGNWDIGMLDMQTQEYATTPGENFGVLRTRRQVINENSFVGGIFTSRLGMNGAHNFAYGLDGIFRVFGDDYLDIKAAQTYSDKIDNKLNSIDPMFLSAKWERRSQKGFAYGLGYSYSGQEFNPGIGFVNMGSLQGLTGSLLYGWLPGKESKIYSLITNVVGSKYTRLIDNKLESISIKPAVKILYKSNYQGEVSLEYQQEGVFSDFALSDSVKVLAGEYTFTQTNLQLSTPSSKSLYATLNLFTGGFYDGNRFGVSLAPAIDVSSSLQISGSYQFNHIEFQERNKQLNIHIAYAKVLYMLSTKLSATVFVQYVSTRDDLISNFRLRYNPREGNDFYLVLNDYRGVSDDLTVPELPNFYSRTILLKYTHTFRL